MSFLAFLVAVAYWPGWLGAATVPRQAAILVGVPLVCRLDPRNLWPPAGWLLLCGFAWAIGSCQSIQAGVMLASLCVAFVGAAGLKNLDGAMTGFALGIGVSAAICIAQVIGWQGVPQAHGAQPAGLFFNREMLAEFAAPVFVWAAISRPWSLAVLCAVPLALGQSRVALLSAALGLLYAWQTARWMKALIAAGIGGMVWMITVTDPAKLASAYERLRIWRAALASVTLGGHGIGWYAQTFPLQETAHSDAIQMLVELGIGAIPFLAIPVLLLAKRRGTNVERAVLVAGCVECAISFPLQTPAAGFVVVVVAGFLAGVRYPLRSRSYVGREGDIDLLFPAIAHRRGAGAHRDGSEVVSFRP